MTRLERRSALLLGALSMLIGCAGSSSTDPGGGTNPPPAAATITLTVKTNTAATITSGDIFVRWGATAFTRAQFTYQDTGCLALQGPKTCTFKVPKGQVITVVATDQQAEPVIGAIAFNAQNVDPRSIKSQFDGFEGACTLPGGGICVVDANTDQTVIVRYKPLYWTRINFVGSSQWKITIVAPPVYGIASNLQVGQRTIVATPGNNFPAGEVPQCYQTALTPTHCFSIVTADETPITFQALPPPGSQPVGSPGPINLVSYDNGCSGSTPLCALKKNTDQTLTVKWEYYVCANPNFTNNPGWKLTPQEIAATGCVLRQP